jgi:hypothetical protein
MTKPEPRMAQDGYIPATEGYQPRPPTVQKGYTPVSDAGESARQAAQPPRGGSSAAKPAKK